MGEPEDYWTVYFECIEALDKANINIPFPKSDNHMISETFKAFKPHSSFSLLGLKNKKSACSQADFFISV
jgi:hypothetical protein